MPDILAQVLATPGLGWIVIVTFIAGVVYGFAGFGAALVLMPVVTAFVPVELAVAAFSVTALASFVTLVPRAWGQADRANVAMMILVALLTLPLGLYILRINDVTTMRWVVLGVTTATLLALVFGWRYRTEPTRLARVGVAAGTGIIGGATGLVGPIMVLFQLGGQDSAPRSRANTVVFLTVTGLMTAPLMLLQGMVTPAAVVLGLLLILPYGLASWLGQALFVPQRHALYRKVAYVIIGGAVLLGLPIYD